MADTDYKPGQDLTPKKRVPNVAICVPTGGTLPTEFVRNLISMINFTVFNNHARVAYYDCICSEVSLGREGIAEDVLKSRNPDGTPMFDYLFFIDPDTQFPKEIIVALMQADVDFIGNVVVTRYPPYFPNVRKFREVEGDLKFTRILDWQGNLFRVDGIGFGSVLIKREVFERTPKPWFIYTTELSEDLHFCKKARAAGTEIWATTALPIRHGIGWKGAGLDDWEVYKQKVMESEPDVWYQDENGFCRNAKGDIVGDKDGRNINKANPAGREFNRER